MVIHYYCYWCNSCSYLHLSSDDNTVYINKTNSKKWNIKRETKTVFFSLITCVAKRPLKVHWKTRKRLRFRFLDPIPLTSFSTLKAKNEISPVCVCVCVCECVCMYVCVLVSVRMNVRMYVRVIVYVYVRIHASTHVYACVCACMRDSVYKIFYIWLQIITCIDLIQYILKHDNNIKSLYQ